MPTSLSMGDGSVTATAAAEVLASKRREAALPLSGVTTGLVVPIDWRLTDKLALAVSVTAGG